MARTAAYLTMKEFKQYKKQVEKILKKQNKFNATILKNLIKKSKVK